MESDIQTQCSFNFKEVLIDEVALQGLEGIGLDLLWKLVEKHMAASITDKLKQRYWNFLVKNQELTFYKLPEPVMQVELIDRFSLVHPDSGILVEYTDYLDGPYEYCPVENEYGSCKYFNTRVLISNEDLAVMSYDKVLCEYGDTLVIVASLRERWRALAPQASICVLKQLTQTLYCILELIGRGRENGQCTVGKSNILKIIKDPKLLFYNRNQLQKFHLIKAQSFIQFMDMKGRHSILLRLTKFHEPLLMCMPKSGPFHNLINYLKNKPDYTECVETLIKKEVCDRRVIKRITKTTSETVFNIEERSSSQMVGKPSSAKEKIVKRRYLRLTCPSDESSQSEDEETGGSMPCKYNVGVGLARQAYEAFAEVGLKGLTQHQLAQLLGIEFYTARTMCTIFLERNLIRVFFEDKGKQRYKRYILVSQTNDMEEKIKHEKQKFLNYLECNKSSVKAEANEKDNESEYEVPLKKVKIEDSANIKESENVDDFIEKDFTEVKVLDGVEPESAGSLLSSMKSVTLKQLKLVNGIITVIKKQKVVSGYQPLSNLVSKETNELPVATKALKVYVQKLVTDGQLKLLKMKWPGFTNKYTFLICDTDVKPNDPKLKAKYKEVSVRIMNNKAHKRQDKSYVYTAQDLIKVSYPKYVRIQKLHELITTLVYFSDLNSLSDLPEGVCTLVHIIPEFTVEFALGNINHSNITQIDLAQITADLHTVKLRETPSDLYKQFLTCSSLQQCTRTNLKSLALLGLIQLIKDPSQTNEAARKSFTFYVNRNARLLDTTGTWPREINENENIEKSYYFSTIEDVKRYWSDVYDISTKTTIEVQSRQSVTWLPPVRHHRKVKEHDNGLLLGNGCGPCGFDSGFYLDAPRQWTTYYAKEKPKFPTIDIHRLIPKRKKKVKTNKKRITKKPTKVPLKQLQNKNECENLDQRVKNSTINWTTVEDRVLIYCKVAMAIISPVTRPTCSRVRNVVAKDILSLSDPKKNVVACHRRTGFVENKYILEEECLLNELRCRKKLVTAYENFLRIFWMRDVRNVISATRLPMLELVWFLWRLTKSISYNKNTPCVAADIEDFHKKYVLTKLPANKPSTPVDPNIEICTLSELIMQTVSLIYKNTVSAEESDKIYNLFMKYPEKDLRIALNHIRKTGAVAAVEKTTHNNLKRTGFDDVARAKFRFSAVYQRKWNNRMHSDFMDNLMQLLDRDVSEMRGGSMEMNCLACELQAKGVLEVAMVTIPVVSTSVPLLNAAHYVGEGEIKYKMKPGICEIKNKTKVRKFSELEEPMDYEAILCDLGRSAVITFSDKDDIPNMNDEVIIHLRDKKEAGSTLRELQEITGSDYKTLNNKLEDMISKGAVFRVGYCDNILVLREFLKPWTIENEGTLLKPKPWLTLDWKMRPNLLLKWACAVLNTVFMCPGSSIAHITDSCEFLVPTAVQDACVFLERCGCVKLNVIMSTEPDLFSDEETELVLEEYSANASVKDILVFPFPYCITKLAHVKRILQHLWYDQ